MIKYLSNLTVNKLAIISHFFYFRAEKKIILWITYKQS